MKIVSIFLILFLFFKTVSRQFIITSIDLKKSKYAEKCCGHGRGSSDGLDLDSYESIIISHKSLSSANVSINTFFESLEKHFQPE